MHYLTLDLDLGVKVTGNTAQYPLHHVTYSATCTKFKVSASKGLGRDTFTKKVTDRCTDGQKEGQMTDLL